MDQIMREQQNEFNVKADHIARGLSEKIETFTKLRLRRMLKLDKEETIDKIEDAKEVVKDKIQHQIRAIKFLERKLKHRKLSKIDDVKLEDKY